LSWKGSSPLSSKQSCNAIRWPIVNEKSQPFILGLSEVPETHATNQLHCQPQPMLHKTLIAQSWSMGECCLAPECLQWPYPTQYHHNWHLPDPHSSLAALCFCHLLARGALCLNVLRGQCWYEMSNDNDSTAASGRLMTWLGCTEATSSVISIYIYISFLLSTPRPNWAYNTHAWSTWYLQLALLSLIQYLCLTSCCHAVEGEASFRRHCWQGG